MFRFLVSLTLLIAAPLMAAEDQDAHKSSAGGVSVLHAWAPATESGSAAVYMEIANEGAASVTVTGIEADIADVAILVASPIKYGGKPETVPAFPISAGTEMDLEPGGLYIALEGLRAPLVEGGEAELEITFDPVGTIKVHVQIEATDARRHSHAGHSH